MNIFSQSPFLLAVYTFRSCDQTTKTRIGVI